MEGIDIGAIQEALSGGRWLIALGLALIAISAASQYVTEGKLPEQTAGLVAIGARLLRGVGAAFVAGVVWWQALIAGVLVSLFSKHTLDFIREQIPKRPPQNPLPTGTVAALLALALVSSLASGGCASSPCLAERATLEGVRAAMVAVDATIPEDLEEWNETRDYSEASLDLGEAAVEACELTRDDGLWQEWVTVGLKVVYGALGIAKTAGAEVPDELLASIGALNGRSSP